MDTKYRYAGVPLMPGIAEELILELFQGKVVERQLIVDRVTRVHLDRGGLAAEAQDVPRLIKKALENLKDEGVVENPSFGRWRIRRNPDLPEEEEEEEESAELDEEKDARATERVLGPERTIGAGNSGVYVYYYGAYRNLAEGKGETVWGCKVGRSDRDPMLRILAQGTTAMPEKPSVALLIRTDTPAALEMAIQSVLTVRGKRLPGALGAEWFATNPREIESIYKTIIGGCEEPPAPKK